MLRFFIISAILIVLGDASMRKVFPAEAITETRANTHSENPYAQLSIASSPLHEVSDDENDNVPSYDIENNEAPRIPNEIETIAENEIRGIEQPDVDNPERKCINIGCICYASRVCLLLMLLYALILKFGKFD